MNKKILFFSCIYFMDMAAFAFKDNPPAADAKTKKGNPPAADAKTKKGNPPAADAKTAAPEKGNPPAADAKTAAPEAAPKSTSSGKEHVVIQEGKNFIPDSIQAKVGDKITFKNSDTIAHNVFSKSGIQDFNLKIQKPGESNTIELNTPGEFEVRCAIHPKMILKVTVTK